MGTILGSKFSLFFYSGRDLSPLFPRKYIRNVGILAFPPFCSQLTASYVDHKKTISYPEGSWEEWCKKHKVNLFSLGDFIAADPEFV